MRPPKAFAHELCRVLAPAGALLCLSMAAPETRLPYFCHPSLPWGGASATPIRGTRTSAAIPSRCFVDSTLEVGTEGDYLYIMKKRAAKASADDSDFDGAAVARKYVYLLQAYSRHICSQRMPRYVPTAYEASGIRDGCDTTFRPRNAARWDLLVGNPTRTSMENMTLRRELLSRSEALVGTLTRNVCRDAEAVLSDEDPYTVAEASEPKMSDTVAAAYARLAKANSLL
eukprot:scaffold8081_cov239-Pinguiococcus_pyrenoidosus.AAC.3